MTTAVSGELQFDAEKPSPSRAVKRTCKVCGKEFFARSHQIRIGQGLFCSRACMGRNYRVHKIAQRYTVDSQTGCWNWNLATRQGYGRVRHESENRLAYKVMWEEKNGPVPDGKQLDHLCRNRRCVNPDHLEPVTPAENTRRGARTKLTMSQILEIRNSTKSHRQLAVQFGTEHGHIGQIKRGDIWR